MVGVGPRIGRQWCDILGRMATVAVRLRRLDSDVSAAFGVRVRVRIRVGVGLGLGLGRVVGHLLGLEDVLGHRLQQRRPRSG